MISFINACGWRVECIRMRLSMKQRINMLWTLNKAIFVTCAASKIVRSALNTVPLLLNHFIFLFARRLATRRALAFASLLAISILLHHRCHSLSFDFIFITFFSSWYSAPSHPFFSFCISVVRAVTLSQHVSAYLHTNKKTCSFLCMWMCLSRYTYIVSN